MSTVQQYANGVLRAEWNPTTRIYREWDASSVLTLERPYTAAENAFADAQAQAETEMSNETSLRDKARTALTNNATFLAIATPTTAQAITQVKALTRQVNALIKLQIRDLTDTNGT